MIFPNQIQTLERHRELLYGLILLPLVALNSLALGSGHTIYRIIFPLVILCFLLKLTCDEFTKKQWALIIGFGLLLAITLLINHEKTLLLAFLIVVGSQGVQRERFLRLAFLIKLVCVAITITLANTGITENYAFYQMKELNGHWQMTETHCYGYPVPNQCYMHLFILALLLIYLLHEKLPFLGRLLLYGALSAGLYFAYTKLLCRTGWFMWLGAVLLYLCFDIISYIKSEKLKKPVNALFFGGLALLPLVILVFTLIMVHYFVPGYEPENIAWRINEAMTGRIGNIYFAMPDALSHLIADRTTNFFDLALFFIWTNYGLLTLLFCLYIYCSSIYKMCKKNRAYQVLPIAIMMLYGIGEMVVINASMNVFILLMASSVFDFTEVDV